jgi:pyridoxal phosphate enzyme (YggS family)
MSLIEIRTRLDAAMAQAGRAAGSVTLLAVSKLQPDAKVLQALQVGQLSFGENYVQETAAKWPAFRAQFADAKVHMIGPLQTNKAKQADRVSLAEKLAKLAQARGQCPELFVQVNTGQEPQKAGILPQALDAFLKDCQAMDLKPFGLMCIPPDAEDPVPHFQMLADMAVRNGLSSLSMGMSGDFERAVAFGATHVRVGSAIFGARPQA